jgi:signal transduction histidine kinase
MPRGRQEQFLAIITQESQRLSRMINQLLDLSRIEAGKMEWRLEVLDLPEVVEHCVQANRALFEDKAIELSVSPPRGRPLVMADRDKIIQVLTNLLSNAAKFTPPRGRVAVRTFQTEGEAVVEVEDNGIGVPADKIHAIFDWFRQVGDTLVSKSEGAGLGLPISREIIQHHGGTLTVTSHPGEGSCFTMRVPLAA